MAGVDAIPERDVEVVKLVAKFRQMTSGQIRDSLFAGLASATPLDRALKRLVAKNYLARTQRFVGGNLGGSGQYVYQLGRTGWRMLGRPGSYWVPRAVNLHALAVVDCYVTLTQAERDGVIKVIQFSTEPDCHQMVETVPLTPDAYVEVGHQTKQVKYTCWLEVDRATEHLDKIRHKCRRYYRAYQLWQGDYFPLVLFVVPDDRRVQDLKGVMTSAPQVAQDLFRFCTLGNVVSMMIGEND